MKSISVFFAIIFFFLPVNGSSAPVIIQSETLDIVDGQKVIIKGSDFGSHRINAKWLGGKDGNIEKGTVNAEITLPPDWTSETTSSARQRPVYTNEEYYSGGKSIKSFFPVQSVYTSGFTLTSEKGFNSVYATWWFKAKPISWEAGNTSRVGQMKMFRITPGLGGGIYADQPHNWYWAQQFNSSSNPPCFEDGNNMLLNFCRSSASPKYDTSCYAGEATGRGIYRQVSPRTDIWQRIEIWASRSSPDKQDGTIKILLHRSEEKTPDVPVTFVDYTNSVCTRETDACPWRCVVWQNYFGSGVDKGNFYFDDIYVQFNTQARIEIGNAPTWSACTKREIQIPVKWNPRVRNKEQIEFIVNQGGFGSGPAYLYVVDKNGVSSDGIPVNFVSNN